MGQEGIGANAPVKWSVRYQLWLCDNKAHSCIAKPLRGKTKPCSNCEGYRLPPQETQPKPRRSRARTRRDESLAFKGKWVPNGRGTMIPIFDEGMKPRDDGY